MAADYFLLAPSPSVSCAFGLFLLSLTLITASGSDSSESSSILFSSATPWDWLYWDALDNGRKLPLQVRGTESMCRGSQVVNEIMEANTCEKFGNTISGFMLSSEKHSVAILLTP